MSRKKPIKRKNPTHVASMGNNRLVSVTLRLRHNRNGLFYGPGLTKCTASLAQDMLHTEGIAASVEEQFNTPSAKIIGPRSRTGAVMIKAVPVETFDSEYAGATPSSVVSGAGNSDSSGGQRF